MDNPRPEKVAVVDEVRERLGAANAAILTEYRGLPVKDLEALRRSLAAAGGSYKIYKNTLVGFAARDLGLDLGPLLTGPTAIAFVDGDAAEVAKALREFARTHPLLVIKGGLLGKSVLSPADTSALADLPSREVMLARVAGAFAAPMIQFAGLLQALPRNFAYGLKALIDKGGGAGEAVGPPTTTDQPAEGAATPGDAPAEPAEGAPEAATPPTTDQPAEPAEGAREAATPADAPAEPAEGAPQAARPPATDQPAEGAPEAATPADAPAESEPTAPSTDQPAEGAADAAPAADASSTPTDPAQES